MLSFLRGALVSWAWWCTPLIPAFRRQRQANFWVQGQPGLQSEFLKNQRTNTLKQVEKKVGKGLGYMGKGRMFLNRTTMAYALRWTTDKWDLIKLQSFCKAKDTVNRTKEQPTDWGKIFTSPTSERVQISKIHKELKKLTFKNLSNTKNGGQS